MLFSSQQPNNFWGKWLLLRPPTSWTILASNRQWKMWLCLKLGTLKFDGLEIWNMILSIKIAIQWEPIFHVYQLLDFWTNCCLVITSPTTYLNYIPISHHIVTIVYYSNIYIYIIYLSCHTGWLLVAPLNAISAGPVRCHPPFGKTHSLLVQMNIPLYPHISPSYI